jgi:threonyl-tRNA synthetase
MPANNDEYLHAMRHSLAHIMADAVGRIWKDAKFGVGPVVENGFYYDIDLGGQHISEADFKRIEKEMRTIINKDVFFERTEKSIDEAIEWARTHNQPYKEELLNDLKRAGTTSAKDIDASELGLPSTDSKVELVSFYTSGEFTDLCRGPHVETSKKVGAFKLMRVAGAYWRGKETNPQMQRLYGVAFETKEELEQHLTMLEEAKKRDHRKLGQELDLFTFSELVGPGLPLWTPRGTVIRTELDNFVQEMRDEHGYQAVAIPHITKKELYEKSGHWNKFKDELFRITTRDGHEFAMKPMNCPHHTQIYASRPRSYKELPIRYRETTMVYRDEQTGELGGLSRVRSITQDDAHVFCRYGQVKVEALKIWDIIERFYAANNMSLAVRLSMRDPDAPEKYLGSPGAWDSTQDQLSELIHEKVGDDFEKGIGEAAFYGPKIDFKAKDALGREYQVATIQLDFNQPEGFDLTCVNEQGENERIVMIHCAVAGSLERFMSILIEHTAGRFPVWLAPEQVRVITVNQTDELVSFAHKIEDEAKELGLRIFVDNNNDSVGKKIREAEKAKVPYTLVIGEKEVETGETTPRVRGDLTVQEATPLKISNFLKTVRNEARSRTSRTTM